MYTQFFGNYLLEKGILTTSQLTDALTEQSKVHIKLGTLAIHAGYMTAGEVDSVVVLQTHQDKKFGELAIEEGYLTEEQVQSLLDAQTPDYLLLGQVLKKTTAISMVSNVLALGMSFLTGIFVPLEFLGDGIIQFAHLLPSYWYILGVRLIDSYTEGADLTLLWQYVGIQLLFAVAIIAVGLAYSRIKMVGIALPFRKAQEEGAK